MALRTLPAVSAVLLILLSSLAGCDNKTDLTGTWDFTFTMKDDGAPEGTVTVTNTCRLRQTGFEIEGEVLYEKDGESRTEPLAGSVDKAGNVRFVLTDVDLEVPHAGIVSDGGDTIKGEWTIENRTYPFEMHRR